MAAFAPALRLHAGPPAAAARPARRHPEAAPAAQAAPGCVCGGGCPRCRDGGAAAEALEREADRAADAVVDGAPAPRIAAGPVLPRAGAADAGRGSATGPVATQRAAGTPLDPAMRALMEARLGHDFAGVRLHTGPDAAGAARALDAQAYTVGEDIVFDAGRYAPATVAGRHLLAHELAHVVQQRRGAPMLQRQGNGEGAAKKKEQEEADAGAVLAGGLETVAKQAADNNPQVKKTIIEPLKKEAEARWKALSPVEKGVTIGWGAGALGLVFGSLLGSEDGRKVLEGFNLATPLQLIPKMPLSAFSYTLPKEGATGEAALLRFKTGFTGTELLGLLHDKHPDLPAMSLDFSFDWGYDAKTDELRILGAHARFGILKGIGLSATTFKTPPALPERFITPEGGTVTEKQRLPGPPPAAPQPGFQIMLNVDLLKLDRSFLPERVRRVIEAF